MPENKIRLATTDPDLKDKISVDLSGNLESIYWYIKFNIPLDEDTVTSKNMKVTDTDGYIMRTEIKYDHEKNSICVSPLDTYLENIYYILSISKKVKSSKGKPLKKEIHVLFKLTNGQISQYELLKSTVKPPKPAPRPKNYDELLAKKYSFDVIKRAAKDTLDYKDININISVCLLGILMAGFGLYLQLVALIAVSMGVCIAGVIHVVRQMAKRDLRAGLYYNMAVMNFNKGKYEKARKNLAKAAKNSPTDEDVEYAISKLTFYE